MSTELEDQGSTGLGFAIGFFGGCIGVIIAAIIAKPDTKKGAFMGFGAAVVFGGVLGLCAGVLSAIAQA